jgi:hypothetical protein
MSNLPPFIWVEIGRRPGKYALNAISINKELFPEQERFLIISKQYENKLPKDLCTIIFEEELKKSTNYTDLIKAIGKIRQNVFLLLKTL